jgi:cell division inhibitor SepF
MIFMSNFTGKWVYRCYVKEVKSMTLGLIDKLTNFLMPIEEESLQPEEPVINDKRAQLRVHSQAGLKVYIVKPKSFDDVKVCSDCLKTNVTVLVNYEEVDDSTQQRIADFLLGVCYVISGTSQHVSETVILYVPPNVDINKELYSCSVPTYIKGRKEL